MKEIRNTKPSLYLEAFLQGIDAENVYYLQLCEQNEAYSGLDFEREELEFKQNQNNGTETDPRPNAFNRD
jgi:hypothetical protein